MKLAESILQKAKINEAGPVGGENDGALKFVFKLPKDGKFTANFLDGDKADLNVSPDNKSAGKFAFVSKGGKILQSWDSKPSKQDALDVLHRAKYAGSGGSLE